MHIIVIILKRHFESSFLFLQGIDNQNVSQDQLHYGITHFYLHNFAY
uniref:Uncharacterized protein n=1 Tax=Ascaris lumbricoides TaxID=6252 RepID=A0A0M3HLQ5_ASCLU